MSILKILIDALNYFCKLSSIVLLFIAILLIYIIAYVRGKKTGKWIMKTKLGRWITKRFKK